MTGTFLKPSRQTQIIIIIIFKQTHSQLTLSTLCDIAGFDDGGFVGGYKTWKLEFPGLDAQALENDKPIKK